jgi:hypothetical protein
MDTKFPEHVIKIYLLVSLNPKRDMRLFQECCFITYIIDDFKLFLKKIR